MANESTYQKITYTGKVSARANTFNGIGKDEKPYSRTNFTITEDRKMRTNERDGHDYNADDRWVMSIMGNEDEKTQNILSVVEDLDLGDKVEVEVAVLSRKGYPSFRVLDVRNLEPVS